MKYMERRQFLESSAGFFGFSTLIMSPDQRSKKIRLKGKDDKKIRSWDIVTIGNLSRNRYWGESDEKPLRRAICTCTVISGNSFNLLVDPSLEDYSMMFEELNRRTGLTPEKIDTVFITHQHSDHVAGLKHFENAKWLAASSVASGLNKTGILKKRIEPSGNILFNSIEVLPSPGHTDDHHILRFDCQGMSVVIAGDSVPTRDFWKEKRGYYNAVDFDQSRKTMEHIESIADIIVPGHDNMFFNL
jgi:glyoxylase-like metal-dependent hydrolase (beta-lactamase superfamily II)